MTTMDARLPVKLDLSSFIMGKYMPPKDDTFPVINPATEEQIAVCSESGKDDAEFAVSIAKKAFYKGIGDNKPWKDTSGAQRRILLEKLAILVQRDAEILAQLNTLNVGTPLLVSKGLIQWALEKLSWFAGIAERVYGETVEPKPGPNDTTLFSCSWRQPFGVVAAIVPWNVPITSFAGQVGAAVACGNTIVYKDSEKSPLVGAYLAKLCSEAGFPPGVINVLHGHGQPTGEALTQAEDVRMIHFTGSCATGKRIAAEAARSNLKKVCLELGGKSAAIVFDDADLSKAVKSAYASFTSNSGQVCVSHSRVYVQEAIYDQFVRDLKQLITKAKIGDPMQPETELGPLVDAKQYERVKMYLQIAEEETNILHGASEEYRKKFEKGYYVSPTIVAPRCNDARVLREEIFGPVACVMPFKTEEEVLARVNDTEYGLQGGIYTKDLSRALRVSRLMEAGTVGINTGILFDQRLPFGGWKQSGSGREGGTACIEAFTEVKTVYFAY